MATGIDTDTAFLHSWRTLTRFGSIAKTFATRRNCSRAISNGFSRRCETGASTVVTSTPFSRKSGHFPGGRSLLDREGDRPDGGCAAVRAVGHEAQLVRPARQDGAGRVAAGQAEGVAPRQHVPEAGEQADASSLGAPQVEVEPCERLHRR